MRDDAKKHSLFKPGASGNPLGRPKGSRNKLSEDFIADVHDAWLAHGRDALHRVISDDPATFVKCVAQLMPKNVNVTHTLEDQLRSMSDEELMKRLQALQSDNNYLQ